MKNKNVDAPHLSGIHKSILEYTDVITCIVLGVIMVFFCKFTMGSWGVRSLVMSLGAIVAGLFVVFVAVYCLSQVFPDRRSGQFKQLFNVIEGVVVFIILMAGLELSLNVLKNSGFSDGRQLYALSCALVKDGSGAQSAFADLFRSDPALLTAAVISSAVLRFIGTGTGAMSGVLLMMHFLCSFCTYRLARIICGRTASVAVLAVMLLMPSRACFGVLGYPQIFTAFMASADLLLFFYSRRMSRQTRGEGSILTVLGVSLLPLVTLMAMEPAAFILPAVQSYYICALQRGRQDRNPDSEELRKLSAAVLLIGGYLLFFGALFVRAVMLGLSFVNVLGDYFRSFIPGNRPGPNLAMVWDSNFYSYPVMKPLSPFADHMIYGLILAAALLGILLAMKYKDTDHFVPGVFFLSAAVMSAFRGGDTIDHVVGFGVPALMTGLFIEKVYGFLQYEKLKEINAKAGEQAVPEEVVMDDSENRKQAEDFSVMDSFPVMDEPDEMETFGSIDATEPSPEEPPHQSAAPTASPLPGEKPLEEPSPSGGRWREAPDEGPAPEVLTLDAILSGKAEAFVAAEEEDAPPDPDYPEDDGEVITLGDILGSDTVTEEKNEDISDGSDGGMIEAPIPLPKLKEKSEDDFDFDFDIDDDADFDI